MIDAGRMDPVRRSRNSPFWQKHIGVRAPPALQVRLCEDESERDFGKKPSSG
jgi:hypothetical protein